MNNKWHQHNIRVHYKETDQMGVVHHANYVSWFEIGRTEKMRDVGIAYSDMEDLGLLLPVLDMEVKYHKPARYDECVAIFTKLTHFTAVRMQFDYEVRLVTDEECTGKSDPNINVNSELKGDLLATGKTLHMWLNDKWRPARLDRIAPDVFKRLNELNGK